MIARRAAIRDLFAEFGERLADLLDGAEPSTPPDPPSTREQRRITDLDKQRARNIARRIGRL